MKRKAPKLPKALWSPLGPVPIRLVRRIDRKGRAFGRFNGKTRRIEILRRLPPWVQWQTLRHEWLHMVLFDAGLHNAFSGEQMEVLCDALGTALAAELRNS